MADPESLRDFPRSLCSLPLPCSDLEKSQRDGQSKSQMQSNRTKDVGSTENNYWKLKSVQGDK